MTFQMKPLSCNLARIKGMEAIRWDNKDQLLGKPTQ